MLTRVIRITVGIVLAYGLIHVTLKSTGGDIWTEIMRAQMPILLLALLFHGVAIAIPIYRWNLLLRVQGFYLKPWDLVRLSMIGIFFNLAIPGAVSGDLVKMGFLTQHTRGRGAEAILTVMLDRVLGVIGLFIVATLVILYYLPFLLALEQEYRSIQFAALTVGIVSACGILGLVFLKFRQSLNGYLRINGIASYAEQKLPKSVSSTLIRFKKALDLYRHNFVTIASAILLSIVIHSCLAINLFMVGKSIGENALCLSDYFLATQISTAIGAIPLTPGGIGMRDATIAMAFSALHASPEKLGVLPVIMTLIIVFWRLIGGVIFVISKSPKAFIPSNKVQTQYIYILSF